jgi:hypothetical protein
MLPRTPWRTPRSRLDKNANCETDTKELNEDLLPSYCHPDGKHCFIAIMLWRGEWYLSIVWTWRDGRSRLFVVCALLIFQKRWVQSRMMRQSRVDLSLLEALRVYATVRKQSPNEYVSVAIIFNLSEMRVFNKDSSLWPRIYVALIKRGLSRSNARRKKSRLTVGVVMQRVHRSFSLD